MKISLVDDVVEDYVACELDEEVLSVSLLALSALIVYLLFCTTWSEKFISVLSVVVGSLKLPVEMEICVGVTKR